MACVVQMVVGMTASGEGSMRNLLMNYTCQHTNDENGDGLKLVDVLSSGASIETGIMEIEILADEIEAALIKARNDALDELEKRIEYHFFNSTDCLNKYKAEIRILKGEQKNDKRRTTGKSKA